MESTTADKRTGSGFFGSAKATVTNIILLILNVILLLKSCAFTPPSLVDPVIKPDAAETCSSPEADGNIVCGEIILRGVPDEVQPYMLPVPSSEEADLRKLPVDGFFCLGPVLGNLVFYDKVDNHLITHFWDPVTLSIDFSEEDLKKISNCEKSRQEDTDSRDIFIPVYLYAPQSHPEIRIWKPFQYYDYDPESGTITITFTSWGDQRIAVGAELQAGFGPKP